ncbi:MAG: hypothetical protein PVF74_06995 [Anaerolineales bacterium]
MAEKHKRAVNGEEVWVVLNHVKVEDWAKHKDFVLNILIPAAEKFAPNEMAHTRFLYQTEPNKDGHYTLVFLMDPVIEDGNYDILDILKQEYGDEQAEAYFERWSADQVGYSVQQSPW